MKDANEDRKDTYDDIQEVITRYSDDMFRTAATGEQMFDRDKFQSITEEQSQSQALILPVTSKEVKDSVFAMHSDKLPGIDGLRLKYCGKRCDYILS